jgi:hypothetical protein
VIEAAIAGAATIVVGNSDYTLSANFGVPDEARNAILLIQGSQTVQRNLIVPTVTKIYLVRNITSGGFGINVKTAAGAGVVIPNGETRIVFCDGSSVQDGAGATQVGSIKPSSISQTPAPWNWQGVMSLGRSDAVQAGVGRYTADGTSGATYDVYYNSTPMGSFRSVSTGMDINAYNVPLSLSMGGAPMLTVNTAGNVVVTNTLGCAAAQVTGTMSTGSLVSSGNVSGFSDMRLKHKWESLPVGFIEAMAHVKHGTYERIDTPGSRMAGISAQDLERVLPDAVNADLDGFLMVAYGQAALVTAVELCRELAHMKDAAGHAIRSLAVLGDEVKMLHAEVIRLRQESGL